MNRLWRIIEKEKIRVEYADMSDIPERPKGLYMYDPNTGPIIILDIKMTGRILKCVLAHEIGHFYTSPRTNILKAYTSTNQRTQIAQDERNALEWACSFLMPNVEFCRALSDGYTDAYNLAGYFDVTEWMVHRKFGFITK